MRRILLLLTIAIFATFTISAEIIITQPSKEIYNLGEIINVPITVKTLTDSTGVLNLNLICNSEEINFYKNGLQLKTGEEKKIESSLILSKSLINELKGECTIKASFNQDIKLTEKFTISDVIKLIPRIQISEINPGENLIVEGTATLESSKSVEGFIEMTLLNKNLDLENPISKTQGTITKGSFLVNIPTSVDMEAGKYYLIIDAYEKDQTDLKTNIGNEEITFTVKQVPKNLEIILEPSQVLPGQIIKIKTILHDQTGANIDAISNIQVRNYKNKLVEDIQLKTDQYTEIKIKNEEEPQTFKITAEIENGLASSSEFLVLEKREITTSIINKTVIVKNTGNVPYCDESIIIKIGESRIDTPICIQVGEEKKFTLSAPNGQYQIEVMTGKDILTDNIALTGKAIDVNETADFSLLTNHPIVWLIIMATIIILLTTFIKRKHKRTKLQSYPSGSALASIGGTKLIKKQFSSENQLKKTPEIKIVSKYNFDKTRLFNTPEIVELSSSIKGERQETSMVCLKIKNYYEVKENSQVVKESTDKIIREVEKRKAVIYENESNIFFIFIPSKTKSFKNEKNALGLARGILDTLKYNNKYFKQKIDYGLSVNNGPLIVKQNHDKIEIMSLEDSLIKTKKIATAASHTIFLSEKMKDILAPQIKAQRVTHDGANFYSISDIKDRDEHEKFIKKFMDRSSQDSP